MHHLSLSFSLSLYLDTCIFIYPCIFVCLSICLLLSLSLSFLSSFHCKTQRCDANTTSTLFYVLMVKVHEGDDEDFFRQNKENMGHRSSQQDSTSDQKQLYKKPPRPAKRSQLGSSPGKTTKAKVRFTFHSFASVNFQAIEHY